MHFTKNLNDALFIAKMLKQLPINIIKDKANMMQPICNKTTQRKNMCLTRHLHCKSTVYTVIEILINNIIYT